MKTKYKFHSLLNFNITIVVIETYLNNVCSVTPWRRIPSSASEQSFYRSNARYNNIRLTYAFYTLRPRGARRANPYILLRIIP